MAQYLIALHQIKTHFQMKHIYSTLILCFLAVSIGHSQLIQTKKASPSVITDLSKIKGSPYESEAFTSGKIVDELNDNSLDCYIRYNAYTDEVEVKEFPTSTKISTMSKDIGIYSTTNNKIYRRLSFTTKAGKSYNRVSIELVSGKGIRLFKMIKKEFIPEKKAETSYQPDLPAKFKTEVLYFLKKEDGYFKLKLSNKKLVKSFPDKQKEMQAFIKKNRLNVKNEPDLIKVFNHYNTLH